MKKVRTATFSLLCMLLFCSCQENYPKLILGTWKLNLYESYLTTNGGMRHYYSELINGVRVMEYMMHFGGNNQMHISMFYKIGNEDGMRSDGKWMTYHFDGDYFYAEGERTHIVSLDDKKLVIENSGGGNFSHRVFSTTDLDTTKRFFTYIWYSIPLWLWIVSGVGLVGIIILLFLFFRRKR